MKKLMLLLSLVTLVNCTKEKIVTEEVIVTNQYTLIAIAGEGGKVVSLQLVDQALLLALVLTWDMILQGGLQDLPPIL